MHRGAYEFITSCADRCNRYWDSYKVVEFGSCDVNSTAQGMSIRPLFYKAIKYLGLDIVEGPGVDIVADCSDWHPDDMYDVVICAEVLEHSPNYLDIIKTASKCLIDGGIFIMTCASRERPPHSAIDGGPLRENEYYRNINKEDIKDILNANFNTAVILERDGYFGNDDLYVEAFK
jgi:hypothetical protein